MTTHNIPSYEDYDYKGEFWNASRDYENISEQRLIKKMIRSLGGSITTVLDAGCGFGRLVPCYQEITNKILLDYSENMLASAKKQYGNAPGFQFIKGDICQLPKDTQNIDLCISIRTTHHIDNISVFFDSVHQRLNNNGYFIVECPNKRHILEILRWCIGKSNTHPFNKNDIKTHSEQFYNYHPHYFESALKKHFTIIGSKSNSFLRSRYFKKILPLPVLLVFETIFQLFLSSLKLTPSQIYLCQKN